MRGPRVSDEDFAQALAQAKPHWTLLESRYAALKQQRRVRAWCSVHESEFGLTCRQRTNLAGCKQCGLDQSSMKLRYPDKVYVQRLKVAFPHIDVVGPRTKQGFPAHCTKHSKHFTLSLWNALSHKSIKPYVSCPGCKAENNSCNWSLVSQVWLRNVQHATGLTDLQFASNGGEVHLTGIGRVDGFSESANAIFEYLGDDFHGRTRSRAASKAITRWLGKSPRELKKGTLKRLEAARKQGYATFYVWGSDLPRLKTNEFLTREYLGNKKAVKVKGGLQYLTDDELAEHRTGAHKRR